MWAIVTTQQSALLLLCTYSAFAAHVRGKVPMTRRILINCRLLGLCVPIHAYFHDQTAAI